MAVFVEGVGGRPVWVGKRHAGVADPPVAGAETIRIALVNNMPDAALEDTETQFCELLDAAAQGLTVHLKLVSLPNVPRGERGVQRLLELYYGIDELWDHACDAIIVTGTEPQQPDLRQEPYWGALAGLLEWAEQNTASTILSCLAAHASVLHSDGIGRVRLPDKMFGVFDFAKATEHALTSRSAEVLRFPHSRWNGLPADTLAASGYQILTRNAEAGVDCFVKRNVREGASSCTSRGTPSTRRIRCSKNIVATYDGSCAASEKRTRPCHSGTSRATQQPAWSNSRTRPWRIAAKQSWPIFLRRWSRANSKTGGTLRQSGSTATGWNLWLRRRRGDRATYRWQRAETRPLFAAVNKS